MLSAVENDLLCRVEGRAPMGQLMRRHWIPAALSEQLSMRDGDPIRIRVLGEDLVAFRDTNGRLGVLGEHCPHRKASLFFGRNEECGLRCLYHGWKLDVEGNVLEMVSEPAESRFTEKVKHTAYPAEEAGGFVWIYMGPADQVPAFEPPPWSPTVETHVSIVRIEVPCNWAQIMEGQIDSAHSSSLHSSDMLPAPVDTAKAADTHWVRPSSDKSPRIQVQLTDFGMRYAAVRCPILNAETHDYVRITTFIAPFIALIPPNSSYNVASVIVPRDDVSSIFHFIAWSESAGIDQEAWRKFCVAQVGVDLDSDYRPLLRTHANNFGQDREAMKQGNFTGIPGIPNQDIAMWVSMGPIADRMSEHLGSSDIAVVQLRRVLLAAVRRFEATGEVIGFGEGRVPQAKLRSYQGVVPKSQDWRTLGMSDEESARPDGMEEDDVERDMADLARQ
ncbi:MAG: Rieske 2Fe-2S domain-containing protein [Gemmatimonadaceae bacterium]